MTDFELQTPGGYTTNTGEFRADRKPAVLRITDVPDTDRVVVRITQPSWDANRICFAEFRRDELAEFAARTLVELGYTVSPPETAELAALARKAVNGTDEDRHANRLNAGATDG